MTSDSVDPILAPDELRLFKTIVERSSEAVAIFDRTGRLIYINPAYERLFGVDLERAQQSNYRRFFPQESQRIIVEAVAPALKRGRSWQGVLEALSADGRRFALWERADSVRGPDGTLLYAFGFMHDISEELRGERELREGQRRLEEQNLLLEQKNAALAELTERVRQEKEKIQRRVGANVEQLLLPLLTAMRTRGSMLETELIGLLEQNLLDLCESFGLNTIIRWPNLTRREIEISNMIKNGLTSKEIAQILNLSVRSVENHRRHIRKKLDIVNKKLNLSTVLRQPSR